MNEIHLFGCRSEPLLGYLSGLGVVRLVAEQLDPDVSARWDGDHLVLAMQELTESDIMDHFEFRYVPTPVVAPWNSGSGYQDEGKITSGTAQNLVRQISESASERLRPYREAVAVGHSARSEARRRGLSEAGKIPKKSKSQFIELCRATFPDEALAWLDASVVLLDEDDPAFPLILGTGGNIGRMDLSVNFLSQLETLGFLDEGDESGANGRRGSVDQRSLLGNALLGDTNVRLSRDTTSQYNPGAVGGPNSSSAGDAPALTNPWSFLLAMEGAMVFASAAARRLSRGYRNGGAKSAMPFTVAPTAIGHGSASINEETKGEIWVPLWRQAMSFPEIRQLISEGRCQWGRQQARSGLDFVQAIATLGVDRSVDEFVRYLIGVRHGQSPLAVPVGRFQVKSNVVPQVDLLRQTDNWANRANSTKAPTSVSTALHAFDRARFEVARFPDPMRLQVALSTLADAENAVSRSPAYRTDRRLEPIRGLSAGEWLPSLDDGSAEFRIAVGLAFLCDRVPPRQLNPAESIRGSLATFLRPVARDRFRSTWSRHGPKVPNLGRRPVFEVLLDVFAARAVLSASRNTDDGSHETVVGLPFAYDHSVSIDLADIGHLLSRLDEQRLADILAGLLLLDWNSSFEVARECVSATPRDEIARAHVGSQPVYAVLAPFFLGRLPIAPTDALPNPRESVPVR
ncbi:MAG: type I-U CRISPR-associated protein Csx17, partial [Acidimicrobiaceae bacterium]|nr:type I-U CRISPR-associated protein Csx17 [Acidimicrobiaceae bacterium]